MEFRNELVRIRQFSECSYKLFVCRYADIKMGKGFASGDMSSKLSTDLANAASFASRRKHRIVRSRDWNRAMEQLWLEL